MISLASLMKELWMLPMLLSKINIVLKKIVGPNEFVENEQWSVICMKEKFHPKFATILQIIYQQKQFSYFNNHIIITFDLANKAHHVN
jgi:hypothetical protein